MLIIGLDIGASITKGVIVDKNLKIIGKYVAPTDEPKRAAILVLRNLMGEVNVNDRKAIKVIAASGGGSRFLGGEIIGLPVKRVDEIKAIGLGGLLLSGKNRGLIVSAGTGTAIVAAYDGGKIIRHVCGTGVGGGTIMGLSRILLKTSDFLMIEKMAFRGNANNVDLTVKDIVGGPVGIVPAEATASNLAKLKRESNSDDVAAGIFSMVSQTIGVLAAMAAKANKLEDSVIIVGMLAKSRIISKIIFETAGLFGAAAYAPENCEFSNALGAAASIAQERNA